MMNENTKSEIEGDDRLWTRYAVPVARLFQNKVMFLLTVTLIYDEPLLRGQLPLSGHLPIPPRVAS